MPEFTVTEILMGSIQRKITARNEEEAMQKYDQCHITDKETIDAIERADPVVDIDDE